MKGLNVKTLVRGENSNFLNEILASFYISALADIVITAFASRILPLLSSIPYSIELPIKKFSKFLSHILSRVGGCA
jgi:hypothetical protein